MQVETDIMQVRVEEIREISPDVYILSYNRPFQFVPGQVVGLTLDPEEAPRLYSIASGNREDRIQILFNIVPEGSLTKKLIKLKDGDTLYSTKPFGSFYGKSRPGYFIASGTGLAPYLSMIESGLGKNKVLIHGGRTLKSFYLQDELKKMMGENYIRCCSQEKGDGVFEGRLTKYLRQQNELPADHDYYLCGSSEMVSEARDILIDKGVPFNNIIAEIYF
ncbi:MAG: hypothetical protein K9G58_15215 [Bacteroidales bacterium]|nr:hypothetical protein [Bacteroidales bacterium]